MNKITSLSFLLLFSLTVVFTSSCKKDKDSTPENEFVLNGDTYTLENGFLESYGDNGNGSFDFDITLASSGVSYNAGAGEFNGTGDLIYIDLNTSSSTGLVAGTYSYSPNRDAFTFVDGTIGTGVNISAQTGEIFDATGGTVEIELDGSQTIITFSLTISGSTVTGYFKGVLQAI